MLKDILYNSKILDGLFLESDFKFLTDSNEKNSEISSILTIQEKNRENIINFLVKSNNEKDSNSDLLKEADSVFALVNANIKSLYTLQENIQNLEKEVVEFIVDLENGASINDNKTLKDIKEKINLYSKMYTDVKKLVSNNDITISNFLKKLNINVEISVPITKNSDDDTIFIDLSDIKKVTANDDISTLNENDEIKDVLMDNLKLLISEKENKVFLPYTCEEIYEYIKKYPKEYSSMNDVIIQEYVVPLTHYSKHPTLSRFREAYSLIRDREMKNVVDALKYSFDIMFNYSLNPAIIAACKSEKQLSEYLYCLETNSLDNFKYFKIEYEISPFNMPKF